MSIPFGSPVTSANINNNMASKNVDNALAGKQTVTNTTQSTDKDTGAMILEGGLGVEKNINAGGNIAAVGAMSGSNLSGTNTGDVSIGTANGLSLAGQVLSQALSSGSTTGALSSTDWTAFNSKEPAITILPESKGGTNQSAYTTGDILYSSATNTLSKLPIGTNGYVLTVSSGVPAWAPASGGGGSTWSLTSKTANYTATTSDQVIRCDASGGDFTITLYTASGNSGRFLFINNVADSGIVTIDGNSTETIDSELTQLLYSRESVLLISNGSNWDIY